MEHQPLKIPAWFLTGATGCGKTQLSLVVAEHLEAEIVSMDSMAVYKRMDVGTAKPSPADRRRLPHHLIDVCEPWEDYSLSRYLENATRVAQQIANRGKRVLFCGGTPLYLTCLLHGAATGPPPDVRIRAELGRLDNERLYGEVQQRDPATARRLHGNDRRRLIRALEVLELTGRSISETQKHFDAPRRFDVKVLWLDRSRHELARRIDNRVERMFDAGLVDEVARLLELPKSLGRTARQALGYKEVIEHLDEQSDLEETVRRVQAASRQFAKRQQTWLRRITECIRVNANRGDLVATACDYFSERR